MPKVKGVRAFFEIWRDECGPRDDSNIGILDVMTLAQQPELRKRVVDKRQLRTALRGLKDLGVDVVD